MEPNERISEFLTRLSRLLQADERAGGDLLPVQVQALVYLARCNRYSDKPSAVAEYLGITKGTASQTLGSLEREGLIAKRADPDDGRAVRLRLTRKGRRVAEARAVSPVVAKGLASLSGRDSEQLHTSLSRLLLAIQRASVSRSFGVCHTCRHFIRLGPERFQCGLTKEPLSVPERLQLCREHESTATGGTEGDRGDGDG